MLRASLYVLVFLLCVAVFAKVRSRAVRQAVLLISCYTLYLSWGAWVGTILLASTAANFFFGQQLRKKHSALILWIGVLVNLALLGSFKYIPEMAISFSVSSLQKFSHLALPLGISFWTFQAMSYLFDLYRGEELDPSFCEFATYMAFFPVVISGPVCRMPGMLPQFRSEQVTPLCNIGRGLSRIATGVLMMQLAQLLGQGIMAGDGINSGFDHTRQWSGVDVWCLVLGYGLQLFFDFAGYSHIAIGAAQALGFAVPENFARPFQSTSPSIFWTRWHMSLSFWVRDYVFLLLIVLRREVWWRNLVFVISMVLFGLWHKATVLFLLWGLYHGLLLVAHRQIEALQRKYDWTPPGAIWTPVSWVVTIALVSLGWILFRANSLAEARQMLAAVVSPSTYSSHFLSGSLYLLVTAMAAGYGIVLLVIEGLDRYSFEREGPGSATMAMLARNRWFWIPPLYVIALLIVSIVTHSRGVDAAQLMYRNF